MKFWAVTLLAFWAQLGWAQQMRSWELTDCLRYALENGPTKERAQLKQNVRNYELKARKSEFLPQVNAYARYFNYLDIPTYIFPEEEGTILSGGSAEGPYPVQIGQKFNLFTGVSFSQTLFDGRWLLTKDFSNNLNSLNEFSMDQVDNELIHQISSQYFEILSLNEQKKLLLDNLDRLSELSKILEVQYANDLVKRTDVERIIVQMNNLETQKLKIEAGIDAKLNLLKFLMGLPLEDSLTLIQPEVDYTNTFSDSLNTDLFPQTKLIESQKELKRLESQSLKTGSYPTINAFGDFQVQAQRNTFNFLDGNQPWFPAHILGVNINLPIMRGFEKKVKLQKADVELAETELLQEQNETQLNLEFLNAKAQLEFNQQNIIAQSKNRALAERIYQQTEELYQGGLSPLSELLSSEMSLREANHHYTKAILDTQVAYLNYLKATGQLNTLLQP